MKRPYEQPEIYSFDTNLNLLTAACRVGDEGMGGDVFEPPGCPLPCPDPGCGWTGNQGGPPC
jgi:hypothetical protein